MKHLKEIERFKNKKYVFHDSKPTGIEKGKSFKRKSKGQVERFLRAYQQDPITKSVIRVR